MKIKFWVEADEEQAGNIEKFGYSKEEWNNMTEFEKMKAVEEWADNYIHMNYEIIEE
jgi:hypothetical protein